jgi:hypothetical protein
LTAKSETLDVLDNPAKAELSASSLAKRACRLEAAIELVGDLIEPRFMFDGLLENCGSGG